MKKFFLTLSIGLLIHNLHADSGASADNADKVRNMILESLPDIHIFVNLDKATVRNNEPLIFKISALLCPKDSDKATSLEEAEKHCAVIENSNLTALNFVPAWIDAKNSTPYTDDHGEETSYYKGHTADEMKTEMKLYADANYELTHAQNLAPFKDIIDFRIARAYSLRSKINIQDRKDVEFRIALTAWDEEQDTQKLPYYDIKYDFKTYATFFPTTAKERFHFEQVIDPLSMSRINPQKIIVDEGGKESNYSFELSIDPPLIQNGSPIYADKIKIETLPLSDQLLQIGVTQKLSGKKLGADVTVEETLRIIKSFMDQPEQSIFESINKGTPTIRLPSSEIETFIASNSGKVFSRADLLEAFGDLLLSALQETQNTIIQLNLKNRPNEPVITIGEPINEAVKGSGLPSYVFGDVPSSYQEQYFRQQLQLQNIQSMANGASAGLSIMDEIFGELSKTLH